jgi:hypothetical protein
MTRPSRSLTTGQALELSHGKQSGHILANSCVSSGFFLEWRDIVYNSPASSNRRNYVMGERGSSAFQLEGHDVGEYTIAATSGVDQLIKKVNALIKD